MKEYVILKGGGAALCYFHDDELTEEHKRLIAEGKMRQTGDSESWLKEDRRPQFNAIITKSMQSRKHHLPKGDIGGTLFRLLAPQREVET